MTTQPHDHTQSRGNAFARSGFAQFMAGTAGRLLRVVAGIALIGVGLLVVGGTAGYIVAAIGLVPIAAGVFDFCVLGALMGTGLAGDNIRACARG